MYTSVVVNHSCTVCANTRLSFFNTSSHTPLKHGVVTEHSDICITTYIHCTIFQERDIFTFSDEQQNQNSKEILHFRAGMQRGMQRGKQPGLSKN